MGKIVDMLNRITKKENPYKDLSVEDLKKAKEDLLQQREFYSSSTMMTERGYSRGYDGKVISRQHEDAYMIQIKSIDREINRIDTELRRRKEEKTTQAEPEL